MPLIKSTHNEKPEPPVKRAAFLRSGRLKEGLIAFSSTVISAVGALLGIGAAFLLASTWPLWVWAGAGSLLTSVAGGLVLAHPRFDLMRHFVRISGKSD